MAASLPWDDGHGDTKGFDRASIANRSRKAYRPDVSAHDMRLPNEASQLRALALCFVCAVLVTFLYLCIPLLLVGLFFVSFDTWVGVIPIGSVVALTVGFFLYSAHETEELRALAREL